LFRKAVKERVNKEPYVTSYNQLQPFTIKPINGREITKGGCDHWMIVENPEAIDNALANFLDTIKNMLHV
jgi:hypothetical protein